jgi:hypothetical protein
MMCASTIAYTRVGYPNSIISCDIQRETKNFFDFMAVELPYLGQTIVRFRISFKLASHIIESYFRKLQSKCNLF